MSLNRRTLVDGQPFPTDESTPLILTSENGGIDDVSGLLEELRTELSGSDRALSKLARLQAALKLVVADPPSNSETYLRHIIEAADKCNNSVVHPNGRRHPHWPKWLFVVLVYPNIFLKAISWSLSAIILLISGLTVANPETADGELFYALVVLIVTSAASDTIDSRMVTETDCVFHTDLFVFKYALWFILESCQLVSAIIIGQYSSGESGNIHQLISYIGVFDSGIAILRIALEGIAALLGPMDLDGRVWRTNYKFMPESKWNDAFQ